MNVMKEIKQTSKVLSKNKTSKTAYDPPIIEAISILLIPHFTFDRTKEKYIANKSTVKLIKKYTSIYIVFIVLTSLYNSITPCSRILSK